MSQDYNKPLIIPAGSDTFQVWKLYSCLLCQFLPALQAILGGGEVPKLDVMKHQFSTHFPQEEGETLTMSEDPAKDLSFKVHREYYNMSIKISYSSCKLSLLLFQYIWKVRQTNLWNTEFEFKFREIEFSNFPGTWGWYASVTKGWRSGPV